MLVSMAHGFTWTPTANSNHLPALCPQNPEHLVLGTPRRDAIAEFMGSARVVANPSLTRRKGKQFLERFKAVLNYQQLKAYRAVKRCRTAALGGHRDMCEDCTYKAPFSYNSCRSRCCPKCQAQARRRWLQIQQRDLLNTNYFHVVFTLPRTEPAGSDFTQATARPAVRRQFPDPARSGRRSQTPRRRDRIPVHPAHMGSNLLPIIIFTQSFPAADCRPITSAGFRPAIPCFYCRYQHYAPSSATSSSPDSVTSIAGGRST